MKHRGSAEQTGLGGNAEALISGKNTSGVPDELLNEIAKDCYETFSFEKLGRCEAGFDGDEARFGFEPTYQFDPLKLIIIAKDKDESRMVTGRAIEPWAARCLQTIKEYRDYQRKSKFVRFVDKWHPKLFPEN